MKPESLKHLKERRDATRTKLEQLKMDRSRLNAQIDNTQAKIDKLTAVIQGTSQSEVDDLAEVIG